MSKHKILVKMNRALHKFMLSTSWEVRATEKLVRDKRVYEYKEVENYV